MTLNGVAASETKSLVSGIYQDEIYENRYLASIHAFYGNGRGGHGQHFGDNLPLRAIIQITERIVWKYRMAITLPDPILNPSSTP